MSKQSVLIIGMGLIGGSIAKSIKHQQPRGWHRLMGRGRQLRVLAVDEDEAALAAALHEGAVHRAATPQRLAELLSEASLIVIALPPRAAVEFLPTLASLLKSCNPQAIVSDVGSTKLPIVEAAENLSAAFRQQFVPAHPIAGSERSGYAAARAGLFNGRQVILTPLADNDSAAVATVHHFWRNLGAEVFAMAPAQHDEALAATSHLPHLLAFAMLDMLLGRVGERSSDKDGKGDIFRYAGGGLADFSRLAASEPRMWADIFSGNAQHLNAALDSYMAELQDFKQMLQAQNHEHLLTRLRRSRRARQGYLHRYRGSQSATTGSESELMYELQPGGNISGELQMPGDKSISHRALIFGAIADGVTQVEGFLEGEDSLCTLAALREMGVTFAGPQQGRLCIYGSGKHGLQAPRKPLYMGNSGTAMRLLAGLLSAQPFASVLQGDASLSQRPMARIAAPLQQMGAKIRTAKGGCPPLHIKGSRSKGRKRQLKGIQYEMPVASAQLKSCLLLAGLYADGESEISEPAPSRDHSERMLAAFGYPIAREQETRLCRVPGGLPLRATQIHIPGDISSAAFFMVAAAISPGSELLLKSVGVNPTRCGIITLLRLMGGDIRLQEKRGQDYDKLAEPVADISVRYSPLHGIQIPPAEVPLAIDEFPALFIAAACAEGETVLRGAEELRVKESDRIATMADGLQVLGVEVQVLADGIRIQGMSQSGRFEGGEIDSRGDHRVAMAFAVAALRAAAPLRIRQCNNVQTSFPGFVATARAAGLKIDSKQIQEI